jgi:hypothetical protein
MNVCDCYVTEVVGAPYQAYGRYWVPVKYDCWGCIEQTDVMWASEDEAGKVGVGYCFLA